MKDIWEKAREKQEVLHFKNFQQPEIGWEDALNFIYNLSKVPSDNIQQRSKREGGTAVGSAILTSSGYFWIEENNLFSQFKGLRELMEKVNGGNSGENCVHYSRDPGYCNCGEEWHVQTLRFVIGEHHVNSHNDPNDVLYWQLLGDSYWKINNDKEYKLEPGDLLYFNKNDAHAVRQDGPRAGIIIDAINQKILLL